jgi:O-antigen/teichoic acid export membrane protein
MGGQNGESGRGGSLVALAASRVLFAGSGVIVNLVMARLLEREDFGVYRWISAVVAIATFGSNLGLGAWVTREVARRPEQTRLIVPAALRATLVLSSFTALGILAYVGLRDARASVLGCAALAAGGLWMQASSQVVEAGLHGLHRAKLEVPSVLAGRLVLVGGSLGLLAAGYGLVAMFGIRLVAGGLSLWLLQRSLAGVAPPPPEGGVAPATAELLRTGRSFGATVLFGAIYAQVDVLMLEALQGDAEVARYGAPSSVLLQLGLAASVISRSFYPRIASAAPEAVGALLRLQVRAMLVVALPAAAGGLVVANDLVPMLFGARYADAVGVFSVLVAVVPLRFLHNGYGLALTALDQQRLRARLDGGAALFNLAANAVAIPTLGAMGAAWTTLATDLLLVVVLRWMVGGKVDGIGEGGVVARGLAAAAALGAIAWWTPGGLVAQVLVGALAWPVLVLASGLWRRGDLRGLRAL